MELVPVNCNGCGAALDVGPETRFVTCAQCGARLEVKRSATAAYTELLEKLDRKTDAIAEQLAEIQQQNELERIDREWEKEREQWFSLNKDGSRSEPNAAAGVIGAVISAVFGAIWMAFAFGIGAPGPFPLFGLVFIGVAIYIGYASVTKAEEYEAARRRYRKRREAVTDDPAE